MSDFANPAGGASGHAQRYIAALLDLLGDRDPVDIQTHLMQRLDDLTRGVEVGRLRTPEAPGKWSMVQVIRHLADSEMIAAYRYRVTLAHDTPAIPGYDQDAWAERLDYGQAVLDDAMGDLAYLRTMNLRLLRGLRADQWERVGVHEERGRESVRRQAEMIAGHDLVHLRQIERIRATVAAG